MAKQFLPANRQYTQPNTGGGTLKGSFNVDFYANRGSFRVSKPLRRIFDENTDIDRFANSTTTENAGEKIDTVAQNFVIFNDDFYALANVPYYTRPATVGTSSEAIDASNWNTNESTNAPDSGGDGVVWDEKLVVIDNTVSAGFLKAGAADGTWSTYLGTGGTINNAMPKIDFIHPAPDGNLYVLDEDGYVHRIKPDDTADFADVGDTGTLNFNTAPYSFTCVQSNSTRMFIGFKNTATGRGGVIEWDLSANSTEANRIHKLTATPRCLAVIDDLIVAVMSDGTFKYFDGTRFVNYQGVHLPQIEGKYDDDFIHHNGWDIIDNMLHFLIKGGKSLESTGSYQRDIAALPEFPSAVYCLDPQVGLYPRFALTNNTGTETHYSQPAVAKVGALLSIDKEYSAFFASYEVYTAENVDIALVAYHDESNSNDTRGWVLFDSVDRNDVGKNIEILHKLLESGNEIKAYYQEYDEDTPTVDGVWSDTFNFHTTDTLTVDDKWLGWVKVGNGAGQFLRVDNTDNSTSSVNVVTFKDANTFASLNDFGAVQFMKFRYFGKADKTTKDSHTLTLPSSAKTRKVRILLELTQAAETTNEMDYAILDT